MRVMNAKMSTRFDSVWWTRLKSVRWTLFALVVMLVAATREVVLQSRETAFLRATAQSIVAQAGAKTPREKVLAIRDWLRAHVVPPNNKLIARPLLRDTAEDTIRSGVGFCGEVTRAFVNLSYAAGIPAQRVNLYGPKQHVVAEVVLDGQSLLVDSQNVGEIRNLESVEQVMDHYGYTSYTSFNVSRLSMNEVSHLHVRIGWFTRFLEQPHKIKLALWIVAMMLLITLRMLPFVARWMLHRLGWVHRSEIPARPMGTSSVASVASSSGSRRALASQQSSL